MSFARTTHVDPRGLRFAAGITTVVLAVALITSNIWVLAFQTAVFAVAALGGMAFAPYGAVFRRFVKPRLRGVVTPEPATPPRFAQSVGLAFAVVGLIGYGTGTTALGVVAVAAALAAAFLNAAFGFCLGCETYLLFRRITPIRKGVTA